MICLCVRHDGVIEAHEVSLGDPVLVKLQLQDLELTCRKVVCRNGYAEVVVDGQK
ncbi:MAG: hypothetical protein GSR84_04550 [Desulfurococcales archaeon]|nr:hypothetical protein [Desulfurococcales archaeon]